MPTTRLLPYIFLLFLSRHAEAKPAPFRIAIMYSNPRSLDVKCAVQSSIPQLSKATESLHVQTFAYTDDPSTLRTAAQEIADAKYDVVVGPMLSHEVSIVGPIFTEKNIPLFLPIASNPDLTKKFPLAIRMISNSDHYAQLAASHAARAPQRNKSIFVVTNQSLPYSRDYAQEFVKQLRLKQFKGAITQYNYLLGQADFKTLTKQIAAAKADLVYAPIYSEDISSLYLSMSDAKHSTKIFTHAGLFDAKSTIIAHYDPKILVQFNGLWDQRTRSARDQTFLKALYSGCDVTQLKPWTMAVWDALNLAIIAHNSAKTAQGRNFVKAVRNAKFMGILGKWELDINNDPIRAMPIYSLNKSGTKLDAVIPASEIKNSSEDD